MAFVGVIRRGESRLSVLALSACVVGWLGVAQSLEDLQVVWVAVEPVVVGWGVWLLLGGV